MATERVWGESAAWEWMDKEACWGLLPLDSETIDSFLGDSELVAEEAASKWDAWIEYCEGSFAETSLDKEGFAVLYEDFLRSLAIRLDA